MVQLKVSSYNNHTVQVSLGHSAKKAFFEVRKTHLGNPGAIPGSGGTRCPTTSGALVDM
jgi:hypothetical protein